MFDRLAISDVLLFRAKRFEDARGWFSQTYVLSEMDALGLPRFVQDNESVSRLAGTVRGLHFQRPPLAQAKLVRCVRGAVFEVAVDIRPGSQTFGHHVSTRLDDSECAQLFVPAGFAHGFCTLTADTVVQYKVSAPYSPEHEAGIAWNDPALAVEWPVREGDVVLSDRDRRHPPLSIAGL